MVRRCGFALLLLICAACTVQPPPVVIVPAPAALPVAANVRPIRIELDRATFNDAAVKGKASAEMCWKDFGGVPYDFSEALPAAISTAANEGGVTGGPGSSVVRISLDEIEVDPRISINLYIADTTTKVDVRLRWTALGADGRIIGAGDVHGKGDATHEGVTRYACLQTLDNVKVAGTAAVLDAARKAIAAATKVMP